jgi:pyruvate/2-oxoglutarate dehydrogenase complex dihydrolipoamide dehydrogenase (E3) component
MTRPYHIVVLGGGAGGLTVAAGAASLGARVALIERSTLLGGDCLHHGCIPSKAFIAAAKSVYTAKKTAAEFGITLDGEADFSVAMTRVRQAIAHIQAHDDVERFRRMGVDVFHGVGRFINRTAIETDAGVVVRGKRIVIATGSRPVIPSIPGLTESGYVTNETVFSITKRPRRLAVIGGGPIGLELAQSFARLGSEVTVLEAGQRLLPREDAEVAAIPVAALQREMTIHTGANVSEIRTQADGTKLLCFKVNHHAEEQQLVADEILVAAGRQPNTLGIGLEQAGVQLQPSHHVKTDTTLRTNVPTIYAVGDTVQSFPFTHAAGLEGKTVVANAVFGLRRNVRYDHVPWVTFTDPELFHLGLTEQEARDRFGDHIHVYTAHMDDIDRNVAERDTEGMVKLIAHRNGHILGAHAAGSGAGDWMQQVVYAKTLGQRIGSLSLPVYPYPVRAAAVQRATDQYWRTKLFSGWLPKLTQAYVRFFR